MSNTTSYTPYTRLAATLFAAAALTACGGGGGDESSSPVIGQNGAVDVNTVSVPDCGAGNFAPALLAAINNARAQARSCGSNAYAAAPPLGWNSLLAQAAAGHSSDMAAKGSFRTRAATAETTSSESTTLATMIKACQRCLPTQRVRSPLVRSSLCQ